MELQRNDYHSFSAVRGVQAGRPCYIAMCPMRLISNIFSFNEEDMPVELRSQRTLNKSRVPNLAKYLTQNASDYTLSSLTASINGEVTFVSLMPDEENSQNIGTLRISIDSQILINDGQHRRAAIEQALKNKPSLGFDHISVLFFIDDGLEKSQQMFADLNKNAIRPSTSISTLYDHREQSSELARYLVKHIPLFNQWTELEKTNISNRSTKLFTISSLKSASMVLLEKSSKSPVDDEEMERAKEFWSSVIDGMPDWQRVSDKEIASCELRAKYVHAHGVILQALGHVGHDLLSRQPKRWKSTLKRLEKIDWRRDNPEWKNRAISNGRISKAKTNVALTVNLIKKKLLLSLSEKDQEIEREHGSAA
ncbi:MAG: DNA sulfur modification protein DndB [Candidatus Eutrophobiaceae bacterium]